MAKEKTEGWFDMIYIILVFSLLYNNNHINAFSLVVKSHWKIYINDIFSIDIITSEIYAKPIKSNKFHRVLNKNIKFT